MIIRRAEQLSVDDVLARREMVVAVADGEITAAALLADWLVAGADARLAIAGDGALLGALVWRVGSAALRFYACGGDVEDVADALVPPGEDSVEWTRGWLAGRSALALDAAAALIRGRGGDDLERAEFARLFAIGEPQIGLAAFRARRKPQWLESKSRRRTG